MTPRDLWEVITFQVSWADSNLFIVILGIIILFSVGFLAMSILVVWWEQIKDENRRERELWKSIPKGKKKEFIFNEIKKASFGLLLIFLAAILILYLDPFNKF